MRDSTYRLTLDIHDVASQVQITAKQNDNARKIIFALMENGKPYPLTDYCSAVFMMKKPNGTVLYNDCDIINSGSAISYDFTSQTTASLGICECELRVYDAVNTLITSPRFTILVSSTVYQDGQVTSSSEYSALTTALSQVSEAKEAFEEEVPKVEALIARETQTLNQAQTYANNSQTYSNNALTYANNASASASASSSSATLSTSEANRSKAEADRSKSEADRAFHTTPEGYEGIVNKVNNNDIFTSDYSPSLTLTTGKGGLGVKGIKGGTHKSKNLIKPTLATTTTNGVTITNNGDGTYTFNGTASGNISSIQFQSAMTLKAGTYKYLGCPSGGNNNTYSLRIGSVAPSDVGNGQTFTLSSDTVVNIYPVIISGTVCSNLVFKPMLTTDTTLTYADYEPYGIVNAGQMGCVDLGTLGTWSKLTGWGDYHNTFYVQSSFKPYAMCVANEYQYTNVFYDVAYCRKNCVHIDSNGYLFICDKNYTDVESFSAHINGVLLAYEVADGQSADEYALVVKEHSDNLLIPTLQSTTSNGVTIENMGDGTYRLNGTATGNSFISIGQITLNGTYKLVGCPNGASFSSFLLYCQETQAFDFGNGVTFSANGVCNFLIAIYSGYTYNNVVIKPMLTTNLSATYSDFVKGEENNLIIPLDSPICKVGNVADEITEQNGVWGVLRRCEISNNEVVALTTPTFEPFTDQTVMLRLKSYSGKTYVTTQEGLAELSLRYSKSDVGAESLNKYIYDDKQISSELDDVQFLGWRVPKDCPIKNYKDKNGSYHQIVGRVDLALCTWHQYRGNVHYSSVLSDMKYPSSSFWSAKYTDGGSVESEYLPYETIQIKSNGYMYCNSASTIGGYLYYQLSTEVVYPCGQENASSLSDEWDKSVTYAINDFVIYKNALWKCKAQNSNTVPSESAYWTKTTFAKEIKALYGLV